jgi:hypothetical protein
MRPAQLARKAIKAAAQLLIAAQPLDQPSVWRVCLHGNPIPAR